MTHKLALFTKTYAGDIDQHEILMESIEKYNVQGLPVFVSVNPSDYPVFSKRYRGRFPSMTLVSDSDYYKCEIPLDGWRYQQVIKANFWRTRFSRFYVSIDSDQQFIKPFVSATFMYDENTPYTVMHQSKDMLEFMALDGHDLDGVFFKNAQSVLRCFFGNETYPEWDWGPSPFIWSSEVWEHLHMNYLMDAHVSFEEFLVKLESTGKNFSEYQAYGEYLWAMRKLFHEVVPIQPIGKSYHFISQFIREFQNGVRLSHLKQNYCMIGLQSKWISQLPEGMYDTFINE